MESNLSPVEEVLKIKYSNGQEEMKFNYDLTSERQIPTRFVVIDQFGWEN